MLDKNLSEGSIWPEQTAFIKYIYLHKSALHFKAHPVPVPGKEYLIKEMARKQGVSRRTESKGYARWAGKMNNIRACADEIVLNDIVYS